MIKVKGIFFKRKYAYLHNNFILWDQQQRRIVVSIQNLNVDGSSGGKGRHAMIHSPYFKGILGDLYSS